MIEAPRPEDPRPGPERRYRALAAWLVLGGVAVLVGSLIVAELRSGGAEGASGVTVANYRAVAAADGSPAPSFELPALGGGSTIALADFEGKVLVLNFWASWCAPCRLEAPDLQAAWEDYRDRGVQFLGVNYRDDPAAARAFVDEFAISYPSVFDPSGGLANDYRLVGLPTTFVIDRRGRIAFRFVGYLNGAVLRSALEDVLAGTGP